MKKTIRIIFLFLLIQSKANCQDDQCKNILNEYIKSMKKFGAIADKVYCLDYTMIVEYFDKEKRAETISAKLLVSETRSVYKSNLVSMFVDDHDGFMVFPLQKQIIWGPGSKKVKPLDDFQKIVAFQDTVVHKSTITSCKTMLLDGDSITTITLLLPLVIQKQVNVKTLELTFNRNKNQVIRVVSYYTDKSQIKKSTMTYDLIDFNYDEKLIPAFDNIFQNRKKMRNEYASYELIDNHPKK